MLKSLSARIVLAMMLCFAGVAVAGNLPTYTDSTGQKHDSQGVILVNPDGSFADFGGGVSVKSAQITTATATISNGTALSASVDLSAGRLGRIVIPAAWTTANITFQTSSDGTNFSNLYDSVGNEYTVTVAGPSTAIIIPLSDFLSVRYLKIRSGTSGTPINQAADRSLTLVLVP